MGNPLYTKTLKPLHKDESVQEILTKNLKKVPLLKQEIYPFINWHVKQFIEQKLLQTFDFTNLNSFMQTMHAYCL